MAIEKKDKIPSADDRQKDHDKRNCLCCKWRKSLNFKVPDEKSERYRELQLDQDKNAVFALLDESPKTLGHTLVISKTPFNDITDHIKGRDGEKLQVFNAAMSLAKKLKDNLGAKKVYIMTMCDDWKMWETDGSTTEHLHFHLVPRYEGMRTKVEAGENLLVREGTKAEEERLHEIADIINGDQG